MSSPPWRLPCPAPADIRHNWALPTQCPPWTLSAIAPRGPPPWQTYSRPPWSCAPVRIALPGTVAVHLPVRTRPPWAGVKPARSPAPAAPAQAKLRTSGLAGDLATALWWKLPPLAREALARAGIPDVSQLERIKWGDLLMLEQKQAELTLFKFLLRIVKAATEASDPHTLNIVALNFDKEMFRVPSKLRARTFHEALGTAVEDNGKHRA